jgi:hypothetical protein
MTTSVFYLADSCQGKALILEAAKPVAINLFKGP